MTRLSEVVPPASWTVAMACGVIAVDLGTVHQPVLSTITLGFAAAVWLILAAVLGPSLLGRHGPPRSGFPSSSAWPPMAWPC